MIERETVLPAMGSEVRILVGVADGEGDAAARAGEDQRPFLADFERALSRFDPDSELCALNADGRATVPCSALLREAVRAGVDAARRSGGLVDPTLLGALEAAGYVDSWAGAEVSLPDALLAAPPRRPARPRPTPTWTEIEVDDEAGTITRPPGVRIDTGGIGKGLAADQIAARLRGHRRYVVDCGGDIRIGGADALSSPYQVLVEHPLTGEPVVGLRLGWGGIATSGLNVRLWRGADRRFRHHLLDPGSGEPAWTGLIGTTALGDSAVEAETLAKAALLSGPTGARERLAELGGVLVHDDGEVELVGPIGARFL